MHVIKQHGQYRSGTNYLKALLERNFDALVLSNGLGHKHHPPADWRRWCEINEPGPAIVEAVHENRVLSTISIKDPLGLLHSWIKYKGLAWHVKRSRLNQEVDDWIDVTNGLYAAWREFAIAREWRAVVIRYEDLIAGPRKLLASLAGEWQLPCKCDPLEDIPTRVEKGDRQTARKHDRAFWRLRRYLKKVPEWAQQRVAEQLDWEIFEPLGYSPDPAVDPYRSPADA